MRASAICAALAFALLAAAPAAAETAGEETEASTGGADAPARLKRRVSPFYPEACRPPPGVEPAPQTVIVLYDISKDGLAENVRIRESTDPCFEEAAVAAIRGSIFEPRREGRRAVTQGDMETSFRFVLEEETQTDDFDARPIKRVPPKYTSRCTRRAFEQERIFVEFDVTEKGSTENIQIVTSTNSCLEPAVFDAVRKWTYEPKTIDGVPVSRPGVQVMIYFELGRYADERDRVRQQVWWRLNTALRDVRKKRSLDVIFANLAEVEAEYGSSFTPAELALFHHVRASARIEAQDYAGALDDLRVVINAGSLDKSASDAITKGIEALESIVAAQAASRAQAATLEAAPEASDAPE